MYRRPLAEGSHITSSFFLSAFWEVGPSIFYIAMCRCRYLGHRDADAMPFCQVMFDLLGVTDNTGKHYKKSNNDINIMMSINNGLNIIIIEAL